MDQYIIQSFRKTNSFKALIVVWKSSYLIERIMEWYIAILWLLRAADYKNRIRSFLAEREEDESRPAGLLPHFLLRFPIAIDNMVY